jgi:hypothetical protein
MQWHSACGPVYDLCVEKTDAEFVKAILDRMAGKSDQEKAEQVALLLGKRIRHRRRDAITAVVRRGNRRFLQILLPYSIRKKLKEEK